MSFRTKRREVSSLGSGRKYRQRTVVRLTILGIASLLLAICFVADLSTGPAKIGFVDLLNTLWAPSTAPDSIRSIVWGMRLPMACLACSVGAALGIAGAEMQTILNNPLASPFTLGVSAAASFGASVAILTKAAVVAIAIKMFGEHFLSQPFFSQLLVPVSAFLSAAVCTLVVLLVAKLRSGSLETIVLGGVALQFFFHAGVALLQFFASEDTLQSIVFWMFGSLQGATFQKNAIVLSVALCSCFFFLKHSWKLTAFRLGETQAESLGIQVGRLRKQVLIVSSLITAISVCFTGVIGFVGLVSPHLSRTIVGEDQRFFLPLSAILGAALLSSASIASKTILPGTVLPIGIVTSLVGVPFFFAMVLTQRRKYW